MLCGLEIVFFTMKLREKKTVLSPSLRSGEGIWPPPLDVALPLIRLTLLN